MKIRAAERNQRLKDVVADALRAALSAPPTAVAEPIDPVQALRRQLAFRSDGTVENPDALAEPAWFEELETLRAKSRREPLRDPL